MKKPIRVNERGIRIGESHPNARLSKSGVKAICDGRSRGQIGPTVDAKPTVRVRVKRVRVNLHLPLHIRAKLHRLGGSVWIARMVEEAQL